ncbi:MAG: D-sedoheptulose 7-phosphate isomerase [Candidatus Desulfofervidus auxilii]|nr:D-sedoheptulose 7-phosphate isomerase [Candidatus Desulfofervidus auxilii]
MLETITRAINDSINIKKMILEDKSLLNIIKEVAEIMINTFKNDGKVFFCGNGGSAADAQHLAAELSGKFYLERAPLFAEALHVNTSYLTAVANDYSYDEVFSRLIKAKGKKGDILVGISTSGMSKNVIRALETANEIGMITVGMTGKGGGKFDGLCKYLIKVPSKDTPRIQEAHIMIGHIICELVEKALFSES